MEISYLDYLEDYKKNVFTIDDVSMIGHSISNFCFNDTKQDIYEFLIRNRKYFVHSDKTESDEHLSSVTEFILNIKGVDSSTDTIEQINTILSIIHKYNDLELALANEYDIILTTLLNKNFKESLNYVISNLYLDSVVEDFHLLVDYKKKLDDKLANKLDNVINKFYKEVAYLNSNLSVDVIETNINGNDRFLTYVDMPMKQVIHRVSGIRKIKRVGNKDIFAGNLNEDISEESLRELTTRGYIHIAYLTVGKYGTLNNNILMMKLVKDTLSIV